MLYKNSVSPYLQHHFSIPYQNKKTAYAYSALLREDRMYLSKNAPYDIWTKKSPFGGASKILKLTANWLIVSNAYHRLGEYRR
jgi:hypothetical protein